MNQFKGTPGPWRVVTFQNNDEIHSAEGKCLADSWSYDIGSDCVASLANARLMAAAPDLLEALKHMVQCHYPDANDQIGAKEECWASIQNAQAAIGKALGEQQ